MPLGGRAAHGRYGKAAQPPPCAGGQAPFPVKAGQCASRSRSLAGGGACWRAGLGAARRKAGAFVFIGLLLVLLANPLFYNVCVCWKRASRYEPTHNWELMAMAAAADWLSRGARQRRAGSARSSCRPRRRPPASWPLSQRTMPLETIAIRTRSSLT